MIMTLTYKNGGVYWGKIFSNKLGKTKNDKPQFILQFEILGEVNPQNPDGELLACPQNERTVFQVLTAQTIDWFAERLALLGFEGDRISRLDMDAPGGFNFEGKELAFFCEHDTYNGKTRERWSISTGKKSLEIVPMDAKDLRALDNLFGRNLKASAPNTASTPTARQRTQQTVSQAAQVEHKRFDQDINAQLNEDGIPF